MIRAIETLNLLGANSLGFKIISTLLIYFMIKSGKYLNLINLHAFILIHCGS